MDKWAKHCQYMSCNTTFIQVKGVTLMRKTFIALAIGMFLVTLVGCNAVEGLGEDITDTSKATREAIAD